MKRHTRLVIGAASIALMAATAPASAHVTVGIQTLKVATLTYRAPAEPATNLAVHHTNKLAVTFPAGFKVKSCKKDADFTCSFTVSSVTWARRAGSSNFADVNYFDVDVRTPGIRGTYLTPALQIYSDDDGVDPCTEPTCVFWKQPNTTDPRPAPQIRVNGPDKAPTVARGTFKPLSELGSGTPCPQDVINSTPPGTSPAEHCSHFGFDPPAGSEPPPPPSGDELDVRGTAKLVRSGHHTTAEVHVTGLEPGVVYSAHLHEGTCANVMSAHYKHNLTGPDGPPNELWPSSDKSDPTAGLTADDKGEADGFGRVNFVARATARAIWIHEPPADPSDPHAHARIGCADLI